MVGQPPTSNHPYFFLVVNLSTFHADLIVAGKVLGFKSLVPRPLVEEFPVTSNYIVRRWVSLDSNGSHGQ